MTDPRFKSDVGTALQSGANSLGAVASKQLQPVWGRITGNGPEGTPEDFFEWEQVEPDQRGEFQNFDEIEFPGGLKSLVDGTDLLFPAVEVNGGSIEVDTIVQLIPTRLITDTAGNVHRAMLFSNPKSGLRPFRIDATWIIPAGGVGATAAGGNPLELDRVVDAEWLDDVGTKVLLYPEHKNEFENDDAHFRLGIGRKAGAYMLATYGWAQFQPNATAITDPVDGKKKFEGEWQIVRLEAETIARVVLPTGADIEPDERGLGDLWWRDADNDAFRLIDSTTQLEIYNDTNTTLKAGEELNVWFDVDGYVWRPFLTVDSPTFAKVVTAHPGNDDGGAVRTFKFRPCDHDGANTGGAATEFDGLTELMPGKDTNLIVGNVVRYKVMADGDRIIVSDIWDLPIGRVVWESVDETNLRQGWRLCDGTLGAAHASQPDSPDLRRMFIMGLDEADGAGDGSEDAIGDTGGFSQHGGPFDFFNNHDDHTDTDIAAAIGDHPKADIAAAIDDHDDHATEDMDPVSGITVNFLTEPPAAPQHSGHAPSPGAADVGHDPEPGDNDLAHSATDNRPKFYVMAPLQRCDQRA